MIQTPNVVYILYEFTRVWRSIAMDREHPKDPDITWMGDSIGRYEGDTLVIDTIGLSDKTWLDHTGHPHSESLHVVERLRRMDCENAGAGRHRRRSQCLYETIFRKEVF